MNRFHALAVAALIAAPAMAADAWRPAEVAVRATDAGVYLTDVKGMALYTYAQDNTPGKSACLKECPNVWPPLKAPEGVEAKDEWTIVTRDDGGRQWAWRGKPLYAYVRDKHPGIVLGDRVANAWSVAFAPLKTPPGVVVRALFAGRTLADGRGYSLYVNSGETADKPACDSTCQKTWKPLAAPLAARSVGDFTVARQADGSPQWAWRGKRLYLNVQDYKPGMINKAAAGAWAAAVLEAASPLPAWVTIQNSDMGENYADSRGMTLYTFAGDMQKARDLLCRGSCWDVWKPVAATATDTPHGEWTPVADAEIGLRWAYKGNPVYVHTRDKFPGAIGGDKWTAGAGGVGAGFSPILLRRDYEED